MIEEEALARAHRRDLRHFVLGEPKVEYIDDFSKCGPCSRTWGWRRRRAGRTSAGRTSAGRPRRSSDRRNAFVAGPVKLLYLVIPQFRCRRRVEATVEGALEAAADVAVGLALKGAPGVVGRGFGEAPEARDRDGVHGPVQRPVSAAVEAVSGALAAVGFEGCDFGFGEANAASLLTRLGWNQLISSWAATTAPTPGSARSTGPAGCAWMSPAGCAW
jgi:hypothetical protein